MTDTAEIISFDDLSELALARAKAILESEGPAKSGEASLISSVLKQAEESKRDDDTFNDLSLHALRSSLQAALEDVDGLIALEESFKSAARSKAGATADRPNPDPQTVQPLTATPESPGETQ